MERVIDLPSAVSHQPSAERGGPARPSRWLMTEGRIARSRLTVRGDPYFQSRPFSGIGVDAELATDGAHALGHADETKPSVATLDGIEPGAVVGDGEEDRAVRAPERDLDRARAGMLGSVSHAFLHHPE